MTQTNANLAALDTQGWRGFWNTGGWWKSVLIAVIYLALYNGAGFALLPVVGGLVNENIFADPLSAFLAIGLQPLIGSIFLLALAYSFGWMPRLMFAQQPALPRKWYFWLGPVFVLIPIVFHFIGIDYSKYGAAVVAAVLVSGLFVGFSEDFLSRGMVVVMLRRRGYREWAVMALSSLIFASLHLSNLITGQSLEAMAPLLFYTFAFGICMYATLRVGRNLIWPIILHTFTDPTTILASGGIDDGTHAVFNSANVVAFVGTVAYVVWAIVILIATRGHTQGRAAAGDEPLQVAKNHS